MDEIKRSLADITKLKKLGWKQKISLKEGLLETIKFFKRKK